MRTAPQRLRRLAGALVAGHRTFFIVGTAVLAVGTTKLTDDACRLGPWLLTIGAAMIMYLGDVLSEVDRDSLDLSRSTSTDRSRARADMLASRSPKATLVGLAVGCVAVIVGLVV